VGNQAERGVLFHDRIAAAYDAQLTSRAEDVLARRAFQDLVARYVPAGSTLLDFGCGTGLDAFHYASLGYRVLAYDNSPGMIAQLRRNRDHPLIESFSDFPAEVHYHAVTANFAVLNHLRDPASWFESISRAEWLFVSVLNPLHWTLLITPRRWRSIFSSDLRPHSSHPCITYLHHVPSIVKAARGFRLIGRANAGAMVRYRARYEQPLCWRGKRSLKSLAWRTPLRPFLGHFVFLVFRRET